MISIFRNGKAEWPLDSNKGNLFSLETIRDLVLLKIKFSSLHEDFFNMDQWPFLINEMQTLPKEDLNSIKIQLPSILFAAKVKDRETGIKMSGYYCIDIDMDDNADFINTVGLEYVKQYIFDYFKSSCLIFISPSRKGIKVVHKIKLFGLQPPKISFGCVFEHFKSAYSLVGLNIDQKCKDWNRLCFLSYDRNALYKDGEEEYIIVNKKEEKPLYIESHKDYEYYKLGGPKAMCPKCNHRGRFRHYVDKNNSIISGTGLCDRSNSCGANIKPSELYPNKKWYLQK